MRQNIFLLFIAVFLLSCENNATNNSSTEVEAPSAATLIQKAIDNHGGEVYKKVAIDFDFRDRHFHVEGIGGDFTYIRSFSDTTGTQFRDMLTNSAFSREINGEKQQLTPKDSAAYANSVNSVVYFALLPYFLQDAAVQSSYLGEVTIKGEPYHKIKVTFQQDGGGKDFDDEYIYWLHKDKNTMDYLAYNYQVDGGGARFREAYNVRTIEGIRFADYINYKPTTGTLDVVTFDDLFAQGKMEELSRIDTENVKVELEKMADN